MAVLDTLRAAGGGNAIAELGAAFGLDRTQADAVVAAVVPELMRKVERNTLSRGGLADLVQALGQGHHQEYLRNPGTYSHPAALADGNGILEHLLGGKDGSRGVADRAARETGVDAATIRQMLPAVAGMAMGGLSQQVNSAFGDILGRMGLPVPDQGRMGDTPGGRLGIPSVQDLPGGDQGRGLQMDGGSSDGGTMEGGLFPRSPQGAPRQPQGDWRGAQRPQPTPNGGQYGSQNGGVRSNPGGGLEMPDTLPDMGGSPGNAPRGRQGGQPFPFPQGGDNPYGDLADILRKGIGLPGGSGGPVRMPGGGQGLPFPMPQGGSPGGGMQIPGGAIGGGLLWQIIRSVIGGAAGGFQSRGIMGWIIKAVLMRYGWSILRTVLGRAVGMR